LPKKQNKAFQLISPKKSGGAGWGGAGRGGAGQGGAGRGFFSSHYFLIAHPPDRQLHLFFVPVIIF
jgi:hypothetical protein